MKVAIVAGETSGDLLGADLIQALRQRVPDVQVEGVVGPALRAAGCRELEDMSALSVMGIAEVAGELPRLLRLRNSLQAHWLAEPPDVFIGIDAPDFNLGLEKRLKRSGVRTVHYVSPTVWAWRPGRGKKIARCACSRLSRTTTATPPPRPYSSATRLQRRSDRCRTRQPAGRNSA